MDLYRHTKFHWNQRTFLWTDWRTNGHLRPTLLSRLWIVDLRLWGIDLKKEEYLYSAIIYYAHLKELRHGSQFYLQIIAFLRKRSPDGATPIWGSRHPIADYYSSINLEGMKSWVGLVSVVQRAFYPHKWSPYCRSSPGQEKFAGQKSTFYHCATQPTTDRIQRAGIIFSSMPFHSDASITTT